MGCWDGKDYRYRPRNHELGSGGDGKRRADGESRTRRAADDAVGGGIYQDRRAVVGQVAKRQAITNPENTIYSIKRFMGGGTTK